MPREPPGDVSPVIAFACHDQGCEQLILLPREDAPTGAAGAVEVAEVDIDEIRREIDRPGERLGAHWRIPGGRFGLGDRTSRYYFVLKSLDKY
jgi:hypothetical protein